jgi:ribosomal protein S27AE
MEGNVREDSGRITAFVGQSVLRKCSKCGAGAGLAETAAPTTILQKWFCVSCGTLNQFEIDFRAAIK